LQALNCAAGGGKAVIFYNRASAGPCSTMEGMVLPLHPDDQALPGSSKCPSTAKYLPAVGLTSAQGLAIKALLDAKKAVTATVKLPDPAEYAKVGRRAQSLAEQQLLRSLAVFTRCRSAVSYRCVTTS
jgi:hypothetical protein